MFFTERRLVWAVRREKLVRDRIPDIIRENGESPTVRSATEKEMDLLLREKLVEESSEYLSSGSIEEIADVLEVVHEILSRRGVSFEDVERIRLQKKRHRGGFEKGLVLLMDE